MANKSKLLKAKKRATRRARYHGGRADYRAGGRVALRRGGPRRRPSTKPFKPIEGKRARPQVQVANPKAPRPIEQGLQIANESITPRKMLTPKPKQPEPSKPVLQPTPTKAPRPIEQGPQIEREPIIPRPTTLQPIPTTPSKGGKMPPKEDAPNSPKPMREEALLEQEFLPRDKENPEGDIDIREPTGTSSVATTQEVINEEAAPTTNAAGDIVQTDSRTQDEYEESYPDGEQDDPEDEEDLDDQDDDDDDDGPSEGDVDPATGFVWSEESGTYVRPSGVSATAVWTDGQWIDESGNVVEFEYDPEDYMSDEYRMDQGAKAVVDSVMGEGASGKSVISDAAQAGGYQLDADGNPLLDEDNNPIPIVKDVEAKSIGEDAITDVEAEQAGGYVKNADGSFARDADGNLIPVIAPETVSTIDTDKDLERVVDETDITAGTYDATQIEDEDVKLIDPATGEVSKEMIAEIADGAITLQAVGVTIEDEEAAKGLADVIKGTISPDAKAKAIKNTGTTLPRVLKAKKQLRNAGLTEEQIDAFANDPEALEEELMNYTDEERKMIGNLPEEGLVGNQIASLLDGIENGEIPTWAKPAYAAVSQAMARRGLDISTVGAENLMNSIIQSAMPIAQANAQAIQQTVMQQVDIEAKAAEADAQRAQGVASQNAQNVFAMDVKNLEIEAQTELFNKKFLQTVTLTNASNEQQAMMQNAVSQANMDIANLGKNERLAAQNAKTFLAMEVTNLSNEQQASVMDAQARNNAMLSNQAADNFAKNANATRQQDVDKFMASVAVTIATTNANSHNAAVTFNKNSKNAAEARRLAVDADLSKANAAMVNDIAKHNSMVEFERNKFNTEKAQMVEVSNVDWRRKTNLANTAANNAVSMQNAMNSYDLEKTAMAMIWQENRDKAHYEWQSSQNEATRKTQLLATALGNDGAGAADNWSSTVGSLLNSINNATYGAAKDT